MPVRKVQGGYRWGNSGKVYPTKAQAERQGRAIHASGYQDGGIVDVRQGDDPSVVDRVRNFMGATMTDRFGLPVATQIEEDETEKFTPSPGQLANFSAMLLPGSGYIDASGSWPSLQDRDKPFSEAFSGAPYPSMAENLQRGGWGGYFDASMQGLGLAGDALYAAPVVGPLLGATVGTGLKTASAIGRTARGARGIASLEEARKIDVDTFARDESGFVSPTIQALIEHAPPDLRGQGIIDWARANANKGVKPRELEFLGLDEYVAANPNATTREAVEGISGNRVRVSQNVRSGAGEGIDFERTIPETDPLDGSSLWQHRVEDLYSELEQGDEFIKKQLLDHHKQEVRNQWYRLPGRQRSLQEEQRFYDENNYFTSFDDMPQSAIDDIVESFAETEYFQNPYERLTPQGEQFGSGTFAFGNEDTGYSLFVDGQRVTDPDNIAYSRTEAEIQLQQKLGLEDHGFGGTEFKQYVDETLPGGENYREVVFNWDNAPQTHTYGHFDDDKQIAHALIRDRALDDGTPSLHIDELQSDLHTKGSREGYQLPEKLRIEQHNKISGVLEGTGLTISDRTGGLPGDLFYGKSIFVPLPDIGMALKTGEFPLYQIEGLAGELKAGRTSGFGSQAADLLVESLGAEKIYELADLVKPLTKAGPVPDYPYKDNWYEMVIKNLLLDAAREGKPALSVSGSLPIKNRYSDEYSKFYEMLYDKKVPSFMKKLANRYGGEFEQGRLDLVDTYGSRNLRGSEVPDFATDNMEANIIRITPEMRERILEEGISSFGGGGIVDVTQGTDPSMVDRVHNFMDGIDA